MENSYTETSPLFSYTNNNKNSNNGVAATINRLQKESFATSLTQIADAVSEQPNNKECPPTAESIEAQITEDAVEIYNDPEAMVNAQEQRRSLLDALIKALTNFTSQFSEEEDAEVVSAVIRSHLRRFHSSRSYQCLRSSESQKSTIRTSATLHNFTSNNDNDFQSRAEESTELMPFLSPISIIKSPESYHTSSEQESSNSERMNIIKNSYTWQQWSNLKQNHLKRGEETHESITMLLAEISDDEDVIYL